MADDGRIKAGAGGLAVSDALGELGVELRYVVARIRSEPLRDPPVFAGHRQKGECRALAPRALQVQLLALHRGARGGGEREVTLCPVDLEQEIGPARHAAADLERHDRPTPYDAVDDDLVGRGLRDRL